MHTLSINPARVGRHSLQLALAVLAVTTLSLLVAPEALAGQGGAEFGPIYQTLTDWLTGALGRTIAAVFILIGLIGGAVRGSIVAFATGIGAGLGMFVTPTIITNVVSATLPILS
jgi:conjugal transfer pilus assembly protein TraA